MEKKWTVYVSAALATLVCAAVLVCAVLAFIWQHWAEGAFFTVAFFVVLWLLVGVFRLWALRSAFDKYLKERRFEEAAHYAKEISESKLFYPVMRFTGFCVTLIISMVNDNLLEAEKYVGKIRQGGGAGWKYRTAYYYTLILLDKGDIPAARAEYEDFRIHNQGVELYKEQLEVLDALFKRLFTRSDTPLPASVSNSSFPVVHRILGKHFEKQAAANLTDWN